MWLKFKHFLQNDGWFLVVLLICVGLMSFALGQRSVMTDVPSGQNATVLFYEAPAVSSFSSGAGASVVASRSGSRYYFADCGGVERIKPANRITFTSSWEAEAAGYTQAANCSP